MADTISSEVREVMSNESRSERTYTVGMQEEGGGSETIEIIVPAGTEEEQDRAAKIRAAEETVAWAQQGDWGTEGASVNAWYTLSDGEYEFERESLTVEIEPDHESLIAAAIGPRYSAEYERSCGYDSDDHDWTSEGEGGCDANPGVWSTGGTTMVFRSHCRTCGLSRREVSTGPQRNPGDHDTAEYTMPAYWCAADQSDDAEHECSADEE